MRILIGLVAALAAYAQTAVTVPAGTALRVRTTSTLSTKTQQAGNGFTATLDSPLVVGGREVARRGAVVQGRVVESDKGGRVKGRAHIEVQLTSLTMSDGRIVPIATGTAGREAHGTKKADAAKIGGGAGAGAAIGALAGGGFGAGVGALAGGAAGTGLVLGTRGAPATIPAESVLTFRLRSAVTHSFK